MDVEVGRVFVGFDFNMQNGSGIEPWRNRLGGLLHHFPLRGKWLLDHLASSLQGVDFNTIVSNGWPLVLGKPVSSAFDLPTRHVPFRTIGRRK